MKKKIIIISVVFIGFFLAVTANSWAQRERGGDRPMDRSGNFQRGENSGEEPSIPEFNRDRGRAYQPRRNPQYHRPVHRFEPKFHERHHYRAPRRFGPNYRYWPRRPAYRHAPARHFFRRHQHSVINQVTNYYSNAESYAASQDEFQASASVSDSGFSVSVGVSKTN